MSRVTFVYDDAYNEVLVSSSDGIVTTADSGAELVTQLTPIKAMTPETLWAFKKALTALHKDIMGILTEAKLDKLTKPRKPKDEPVEDEAAAEK